ncbi:MAG: hypothetical protein ACOC1D_04985 [Prolixibacteraceae bacterium]
MIFLRNILIVWFALVLFSQCNSGVKKYQNGDTKTTRLVLEELWVNLGDNEGAVDQEMGRAAVESAEFYNNEKYIVSSFIKNKNTKLCQNILHMLPFTKTWCG